MFDESSSIYQQIEKMIEDMIVNGDLNADDKIPAIRTLAHQMKVNPLTVQKAYNELSSKDLIYKQRGKGLFVKKGAEKMLMKERKNEFFKRLLKQIVEEAKLLDIQLNELFDKIKEFYNE